MNQKTVLLLLLLILLCGGIFRFVNIVDKGLFFWDEGLFIMATQFVKWRVTEVVENIQRFGWHDASLRSDVQNFAGYPVFLQKPGHVMLMTLFSLVVGSNEYVGHALSAIFGSASILLIFMLGRTIGGTRLGLFAALLLAFSPTHIHYSRVGLHEITSSFFVLLAVWFHVLSFQARYKQGYDEILYFCAGVALSYAVICSYRWLIFVPYLVIFDVIFRSWKGRTKRHLLWRFTLFISGYLLPLSFAEFCYFICFYPDYIKFQPASFFMVLLTKFRTETHFDLVSPFHYLGLFSQMEGLVFMILVGLSLVVIFRKRSWIQIYLVGLFLIPFILYSLNTTRVARALSILAPLMVLLVAHTLANLRGKLTLRSARVSWIAFALLLSPLPWFMYKDIQIVKLRSGYQQAFELLQAESSGKHLSTMAPLGAVTFGRHKVPLHPPYNFEDLKMLCAHDEYRFFLVDWQKYVWYYPSIQYLEDNYEPIKIIQNPYLNFPTVLNENYIPTHLEKLRDHDSTLFQIKIYDLNQIFGIPVPIHSILVNNRDTDQETGSLS